LNLTPICASHFAQSKGVPIITWTLPFEGKGNLDPDTQEKILDLSSGLNGIFVAGAPAYINENIDPGLGLANGTQVTLHSLTFCDKISPRQVGDVLTQMANASPGQRIHLDHSPKFIHIVVPGKALADWPQNASLSDSQILVPIGLRSTKKKVQVFCEREKIASVDVKVHRLDLAFVRTFHKLQGSTLEGRIILDLNFRPFSPRITFEMVLVALSRVRNRDQIRIMPLSQRGTLSYLKKLSPDPDLLAWFSRYNGKGNWKGTPEENPKKPIELKKPVEPASKNPKSPKSTSNPQKPPVKGKAPVKLLSPLSTSHFPSSGAEMIPHENYGTTLQLPRGIPWNSNSCHLDSVVESFYACACFLGRALTLVSPADLTSLLLNSNTPESIWNSLLLLRHNIGSPGYTTHFVRDTQQWAWEKLAQATGTHTPYGRMEEAYLWVERSPSVFGFSREIFFEPNAYVLIPNQIRDRDIWVLEYQLNHPEIDLNIPVLINGEAFRFVASVRFSQLHYFSYVLYNDRWHFFDDLDKLPDGFPILNPLTHLKESQMEGTRSLFFLARVGS